MHLVTPFQLEIVLHQHPVVDCRNPCRGLQRTIRIEAGRRPDNIIHLPFAGLFAGIGQGNRLFVNTGGLTIYVGRVIVTVEYLDFVAFITRAGGRQKIPLCLFAGREPLITVGIRHSICSW